MEYKKYGRKIVNAIEGIDNPAYKVSLDCIRRSHFTIGTIVMANTIYDGFKHYASLRIICVPFSK